MNLPIYVKVNPLVLRNQVRDNFEEWVVDLKNIGVRGIWMLAWDSGKAFFPTNIIPVEAEFPFQKLRNILHNNGLLWFTTCQIFHDPISFEKQISLRPINADGETFRPDSWYFPICPSSPEFKARTLALLRAMIDICLPDGITMDFIRFPFFWEKIYSQGSYKKISKDFKKCYYCFCNRCINEFFAYIKKPLPDDPEKAIINDLKKKWLEWRIQIITNVISEFVQIASEINRPLICHIVAPPPENQDMNILTGLTAQNYIQISRESVILSPMLYEETLKFKEKSWAKDVIKKYTEKPETLLLPSIAFHESRIQETKETLKNISKERTESNLGVVLYGRDASDPRKLAKIISL